MNNVIDLRERLDFFIDKAAVYIGTDLQAHVEFGKDDSSCIIVTGDNATGKSLFSRYMINSCLRNEPKVEPLVISMTLRTSSSIATSFVYNDHRKFSTGVSSIGAVLSGIHTSKNRIKPHYLILDEPDIGLSYGYQAALGKYISDYLQNIPAYSCGIVLVTHSQILLKHLVYSQPHHIRFGGDNLSLVDVVNKEQPAHTIEELLSLSDRSIALMKSINPILDS